MNILHCWRLLACRTAGSIRTAASLTGEADRLVLHNKSLNVKSNKTAIWTNLLYAFTQVHLFWVISFAFWYGSTIISRQGSYHLSILCRFDGIPIIVLLCSSCSSQGTTFSTLQVISYTLDIFFSKVAGSDTIRHLDSVPEMDAALKEGDILEPNVMKGHVRFDDIHFTWHRILRDHSFEVKPDTYIALVGASGWSELSCKIYPCAPF